MKRNKLCLVIIAALVCILTLNTVSAVDTFDVNGTVEVMKLSEDGSNFSLPFLRVSEKRMLVDRVIDQTGIYCCNSSVDVTENLTGLKGIFANDSLRIDGEIEYLFACVNGNTIINKDVNKTMFVYCSGKVIVAETANVKGNLVVCAPELEINGEITGVISGTTSKMTVNKSVEGTIKIKADEVNFAEEVTVGTLEIETTNQNLVVAEEVANAVIEKVSQSGNKVPFRQKVFEFFVKIVRDLTVYLLLLIIVKKEGLDNLKEKANVKGLLKKGLKGYLMLLAILAFGCITVISVPQIGVSALIISVGAMVVVTLIKNIVVGTLISRLAEDKYQEMGVKVVNIISALISFIILELIEIIPYVGGIISFIVFIIALAIIIALFQNKEETKKV